MINRIIQLSSIISIYLILFLTSNCNILADIRFIDIIERLIETEMEGEEADYAISLIEYYNLNKIHLLSARSDEIADLPTISKLKANSIISFLKKNPNASMNDLLNSVKLTELQEGIIRYCTDVKFGRSSEVNSEDFLSIKSTLDKPLQSVNGFNTNKYMGTNFGWTNKLHSSIQNIKFGASTDKDIGENSITDHYAFYLQKQVLNHKITIGNFKISSGLGLILGNSFSNSKYSSLLYNTAELKNLIAPDVSPYNSKSFRGIAYQGDYLISPDYLLTFSAWASNIQRSATINDSSEISSIYSSNLFRTISEESKKNNVDENNFGASIQFRSSVIYLIYTGFYSKYSVPSSGSSGNTYFGDNAFLQSVALQYTADSIIVSAEIAKYLDAFASQANFKYHMPKTTAGISFRYFSQDFRSPYGTNLYESSYPVNEIGLGFGISHDISKKISIEAVADYFETINRTYINFLPIKGFDFELRSGISISKSNKLFLRIKYDNKDSQTTLANKIKIISKESIFRGRIEYEVRYSQQIKQKFRADIANAPANDINKESIGYSVYTELTYTPFQALVVKPAIAIYSSDDYNTAIWIFNSFANSSMQMKPLYEKGIYGKINLSYQLSNSIAAYLQYTINYKPEQNSMGSGYNKIDNNIEQLLRINVSLMIR